MGNETRQYFPPWCGEKSPEQAFNEAAKQFSSVMFIVTILLGLVCNTLSFIVFLTKDMRHRSVSRYLLVLSCSDNLYLLTEFLTTWFVHRADFIDTESAKQDANILHSNLDLCRAAKYLGMASRFISSWIIVTFTAERAFATYQPLSYNSTCNLRRTNISVVLTVVAGLVLTSYSPLFAEVRTAGDVVRCAVPPELFGLYSTLTYAFVALTFALPLWLILVLNVLIIIQLRKDANSVARRSTYVPRSPNHAVAVDTAVAAAGEWSPSGGRTAAVTTTRYRHSGHKDSESRSDPKITITLVVVSKVFFFLNFPYIIAWVVLAMAPQCPPPFPLTTPAEHLITPTSEGVADASTLHNGTADWTLGDEPDAAAATSFVQPTPLLADPAHCECMSRIFIKRGMLTLLQTLHILNYAINFFLYCITGRIFRTQLVKTFCRRWHRPPTTSYQSMTRSEFVVSTHAADPVGIPLTPRTNGFHGADQLPHDDQNNECHDLEKSYNDAAL